MMIFTIALLVNCVSCCTFWFFSSSNLSQPCLTYILQILFVASLYRAKHNAFEYIDITLEKNENDRKPGVLIFYFFDNSSRAAEKFFPSFSAIYTLPPLINAKQYPKVQILPWTPPTCKILPERSAHSLLKIRTPEFLPCQNIAADPKFLLCPKISLLAEKVDL